MDFLKRYWKAVAEVLAAVAAAVVAAQTGDGVISNQEWVNVAILGVGAAAVFAAPNVPGAKYTKAVIAVLTAVLTLLASHITGGLTQTEILQLVVAGLGALGVYAVPNTKTQLA